MKTPKTSHSKFWCFLALDEYVLEYFNQLFLNYCFQVFRLDIFDCCKQSLKLLLLPPIHPPDFFSRKFKFFNVHFYNVYNYVNICANCCNDQIWIHIFSPLFLSFSFFKLQMFKFFNFLNFVTKVTKVSFSTCICYINLSISIHLPIYLSVCLSISSYVAK